MQRLNRAELRRWITTGATLHPHDLCAAVAQRHGVGRSTAGRALRVLGERVAEHSELEVEVRVEREGFAQDFEAALLSYMNSTHGDLMKKINQTGDYTDETAATFKQALTTFVSTQTW